MPQPVAVRSFSKINLGLRIGPLRADGFHHLTTLFQTVALHDVVTVSAEPASVTEITLESNDARVPRDARNTAFRMVMAALEAMRLTARVKIHLQKNLPLQGGMGAGSANAAAALLGLERQIAEWDLPGQSSQGEGDEPGLLLEFRGEERSARERLRVTALVGPARLHVGEAVGSDVPLFLLGGTVYAHNRGELVMPYPDLPSMPCVVVLPGAGSSTPAAFRAWDERMTRLTPEEGQARLDELSRVYASALYMAEEGSSGASPHAASTGTSGVFGEKVGAYAVADAAEDLAGNPLLALVRTGIENDFEQVVFPQHPSLRVLKHALLGSKTGSSGEFRESAKPFDGDAIMAMLSGSGSSLFGLYRTAADAGAAQRRILELGMPGVKTLLTHTVPRHEYWKTMFDV